MHIEISLFNLQDSEISYLPGWSDKTAFLEGFLSSYELAIFSQLFMLFHKLWSKLKNYFKIVC